MHQDDDGAPFPHGGLLAGLLHQLLGQKRVEEVVEHTNSNRFLVELMMRLVLERENLVVLMMTTALS